MNLADSENVGKFPKPTETLNILIENNALV
jgi:hypothetical protein